MLSWLRRMLAPPVTTRRLLAAVALVGVLLFAVAWSIATFSLRGRLGGLAGEYVTALAEADGDRAYDLLCVEAQTRTSVDELTGLASELGGVELLNDSLRGSGSRGLWPWTEHGQGGVMVRVDGREETRYLDMRDAEGWRVCPRPGDSLLGRDEND